MKLLLTSNGLSNGSIAKAFAELIGKPPSEAKVAFIPTAAYGDLGNKDWLINDLYRIKEQGYYVDIIELTAVKKHNLKQILEGMDALFVGGGNCFYLSYWMEKTGLFAMLPELLENRVYAGISAGSMIVTHSIRTASQAIENRSKYYDEEYGEFGPEGQSAAKTAKLVNFVVRPHLGSREFPNIRGDYLKEIAKDVHVPLYAIDDQTAIKVVDGKVEVVSEGSWKLYD